MRITGILGAYGGQSMMVDYPNGDRVAYVTTAFECELVTPATPDQDELLELGWFRREEVKQLPRLEWIDRVIDDAPVGRGA